MPLRVPNHYRIRTGDMASRDSDGNNGLFQLPPIIPGRNLLVMASDGLGWEHVSVSILGRKQLTPTWMEMDHVRGLFWEDEDVVIQYHPKRSQHVNNHPGCLHMWRPLGVELPTPLMEMVGIKGVTPEETERLVKAGVRHADLIPPELLARAEAEMRARDERVG